MRKQKILSKPKVPWDEVLRTFSGANLQAACKVTAAFPEKITLNIQFKPELIVGAGIQIQGVIDGESSPPALLYEGTIGAQQRFKRCAAISLLLKDAISGNIFSALKEGEVLWCKPFLHQTQSLIEHLTVRDHKLVNAETGTVHIYPYGGAFSKEGDDIGSPVWFTVAGATPTQTHITILNDADLHAKEMAIDRLPANFTFIHDVEDITQLPMYQLPLNVCAAFGLININLQTICGEETWEHAYASVGITREKGTLNGTLQLKRVGIVKQKEV